MSASMRMPAYYFRLTTKAQQLLWYIMNLARQRAEDIAARGHFYISMRSIHNRLALPDPADTKNPTRDIKDAIDSAVEAIEKEQGKAAQQLGVQELAMEIEGDELPVKEFLTNARLKVIVNGAYAELPEKIAENTAREIEKKKKQQEKIKEEAAIRAELKKRRQND